MLRTHSCRLPNYGLFFSDLMDIIRNFILNFFLFFSWSSQNFIAKCEKGKILVFEGQSKFPVHSGKFRPVRIIISFIRNTEYRMRFQKARNFKRSFSPHPCVVIWSWEDLEFRNLNARFGSNNKCDSYRHVILRSMPILKLTLVLFLFVYNNQEGVTY